MGPGFGKNPGNTDCRMGLSRGVGIVLSCLVPGIVGDTAGADCESCARESYKQKQTSY